MIYHINYLSIGIKTNNHPFRDPKIELFDFNIYIPDNASDFYATLIEKALHQHPEQDKFISTRYSNSIKYIYSLDYIIT